MHETYTKIETLFRRDEKTFIVKEGEYRLPEFDYLRDNLWQCTEKIDGTNIRVIWDGTKVEFRGRTDNAQLHADLFKRLLELFLPEKLQEYPAMTLYGEGYGAGIQKGGGLYTPIKDFILFDVRIDEYWLEDESMRAVADKLGVKAVPQVFIGTIPQICVLIKQGLKSTFGDFWAEGVVAKPLIRLIGPHGRIVLKLKRKDFGLDG